MPNVTCPSCGERGKISSQLVGERIKCRKCGVSFQVVAPPARTTGGPSPVEESYEGIRVEGLDSTAWVAPAETPVAPAAPPAPEAAPEPHLASRREYKLLTQKDKFFEGKFDLGRLEEALNHYAQAGWVARSMITPQVKGFSGTLQEEIVVLLER